MPSREPAARRETVVVDRVACTGHGVCRIASEQEIALDEWGYPVPSRIDLDPAIARDVVRLCPARAILALHRPAPTR